MLKVIVDKKQGLVENLDIRSGNKNGRDWEIRTQELWVFEEGALYPLKVSLPLPKAIVVYPSGEYQMSLDKAFSVGSFNAPNIDTRKLILQPVSTKN